MLSEICVPCLLIDYNFSLGRFERFLIDRGMHWISSCFLIAGTDRFVWNEYCVLQDLLVETCLVLVMRQFDSVAHILKS